MESEWLRRDSFQLSVRCLRTCDFVLSHIIGYFPIFTIIPVGLNFPHRAITLISRRYPPFQANLQGAPVQKNEPLFFLIPRCLSCE